VIVKKINKLKEKEHRLTFYKDTSLMLAMFFLPFGYDALFKLIMDVSGSNDKIEWKTSKTAMEKNEPSNEFPTTKSD
jgi:hypothetical protein